LSVITAKTITDNKVAVKLVWTNNAAERGQLLYVPSFGSAIVNLDAVPPPWILRSPRKDGFLNPVETIITGKNGPAEGGLLPRAIKTIAPAVIETKSATKTFTDRGWCSIISSLKKVLKTDAQSSCRIILLINIGTYQRIAANFGRNFVNHLRGVTGNALRPKR
jgi:hypothetical protein